MNLFLSKWVFLVWLFFYSERSLRVLHLHAKSIKCRAYKKASIELTEVYHRNSQDQARKNAMKNTQIKSVEWVFKNQAWNHDQQHQVLLALKYDLILKTQVEFPGFCMGNACGRQKQLERSEIIFAFVSKLPSSLFGTRADANPVLDFNYLHSTA